MSTIFCFIHAHLKIKSFEVLCCFLLLPVFNSCDPYQLVFVRNYSDSVLNVKVQVHKNVLPAQNSEITYIDSIITGKKALLNHQFEKKTTVEFINDSIYLAKLPLKSTGLLYPLTIGFPIYKLEVIGSGGSDTIQFYGSKSKMKKQLKDGKLEKVNWTFYIYNYKKPVKN